MNEKYGDWYIISIDGIILRAKIVHKSREQYGIVENTKEGKYINRIVNAADILK